MSWQGKLVGILENRRGCDGDRRQHLLQWMGDAAGWLQHVAQYANLMIKAVLVPLLGVMMCDQTRFGWHKLAEGV